MIDDRIIPGCWIKTENFGKAVCIETVTANKYADGENGIYICGTGDLCYDISPKIILNNINCY